MAEFFESAPLWLVFAGSLGLVLLCLEVGRTFEKWRQRQGHARFEVSGAMSAASMGLLSFLLAFTFNGAANRHDARKALVVEETNAVAQAWRRAGLLPDPARMEMRGLLVDYVDLRVKAVQQGQDLAPMIRASDALQDRMWTLAEEVSRQASSQGTGLFIRSLDDVFDVHLKRLTVGVRNRVPPTIWGTLYLLLVAGMVMMGVQMGQGNVRHPGLSAVLALTFSLVFFLIADLDRPGDGLLQVSQQAMLDLQARLHPR
jgi:hypothetical protein